MPSTPQGPRKKVTTHHVDAKGKRCRSTAPGARKVRHESATYWATVGGELVNLGLSDLGAAWVEYRARLRRLRDEAAGLASPEGDAARLPLSEHLAAWEAHLRARGTAGEKEVGQVVGRVRRLVALAGWTRVADVTDDTLTAALADLRQPAGQRGGANATRNHYLRSTLRFARWVGKRVGRQLLAGEHRRYNEDADRRHERRCPSDDDLQRLFAHLASPDARTRLKLTPAHRALGYRVCLYTGLRADELRTLTRESFDLKHGTVTVRASFAKARRLDVVPLPPWLVAELKTHFASVGEAWGRVPRDHPGRKLLVPDLARAGVPYETAEGFFDFHSMRVWFITQLAHQPGMSLATLLSLSRHVDPKLTLKIYTRVKQGAGQAATGQLPRV